MPAPPLRRLLAAATFALAALDALAQAAAPLTVALTPERVAGRAWSFRGEAGMASAANRGFMSNAGFVVTRDGVVVKRSTPGGSDG